MTTHRILAATAAALGLFAIIAGQPQRGGSRIDLDEIAADVAYERDHVSAITLAQWIREQRTGLRVIDLRDSAAYEQLHIPTAVRMDVESASKIDVARGTRIVLYSEGGTHAAQVWFMLRARGYRNVYFLREGMYEWATRVMSPMLATDATAAERAAYERDAEISRYFGGMPKRDVDRTQIPDGYWLHESEHENHARDEAIANVRRRGC